MCGLVICTRTHQYTPYQRERLGNTDQPPGPSPIGPSSFIPPQILPNQPLIRKRESRQLHAIHSPPNPSSGRTTPMVLARLWTQQTHQILQRKSTNANTWDLPAATSTPNRIAARNVKPDSTTADDQDPKPFEDGNTMRNEAYPPQRRPLGNPMTMDPYTADGNPSPSLDTTMNEPPPDNATDPINTSRPPLPNPESMLHT
jgi:hypothetical protein